MVTEAVTASHEAGTFYLYSVPGKKCPHCEAAQATIEMLNLPLVVRYTTPDAIKSVGLSTVPQIYLGQRHIGGRSDLELFLNEMGMLPLFKRLKDDAILPKRGTADAAGMDLYACFDPERVAADHYGVVADQVNNAVFVEPMARVAIPTGWAVMLPKGTYGRVAPRGGLAVKQGIDTLAGVIDRDYRGEIIACLVNLGNEDVQLCNGDRIAQLVLEKIAMPRAGVEVAELPDTARGEGRYGSTGR